MNDQSEEEWRIENASVRKKILLIDDEVDLCILMRNYFRRKNYEVYIAHDAQDGIDCINKFTPDIIITSIELQDWELVRKHAVSTVPHTQFLLGGIDKVQMRKL